MNLLVGVARRDDLHGEVGRAGPELLGQAVGGHALTRDERGVRRAHGVGARLQAEARLAQHLAEAVFANVRIKQRHDARRDPSVLRSRRGHRDQLSSNELVAMEAVIGKREQLVCRHRTRLHLGRHAPRVPQTSTTTGSTIGRRRRRS